MRSVHPTVIEAEIEGRILSLLRARRKLTFSSLADAIPERTWYDLFQALNRLRDRRYVQLAPLRWDYEVTLKADMESASVPLERTVGPHDNEEPRG
ncbi:MAG: hypothetical protein ACREJU_14930 [Nitrospiraceae bacterium]